MAGLDQAGLMEIVEDILLRRRPDIGAHMANNIFLTGGFSLLPQFDERIKIELTSMLPVGTSINVRRARDPKLDAWRGMAKWATSPEFDTAKVTRQEYLEMGSHYMKEHRLGNDFC
jgi:actin-related protein 5